MITKVTVSFDEGDIRKALSEYARSWDCGDGPDINVDDIKFSTEFGNVTATCQVT
jgi:hypothetical protein